MVLSYTNEVNEDFKERMVWWYTKLNNVKLKIWQDPWLDFMLCWMIFDAYLTEISQSGLDCDKLNYFYQNKSDFKDMRPNSGRMVYLNDENSLEQTFDFVYQIRCNLFHGAKDIKNARDADLVSRGAKFLRFCIDRWMYR